MEPITLIVTALAARERVPGLPTMASDHLAQAYQDAEGAEAGQDGGTLPD